MLGQRFFTFLLLACYGLPACLGPAWHRHTPGGSGCACHSVAGHAADDHSHGADSICRLCADCSTRWGGSRASNEDRVSVALQGKGQSKTEASQAQPQFVLALIDEAPHGPCAICAFYAQASWGGQSGVVVCLSQPTRGLVIEPQGNPVKALFSVDARGPPCVRGLVLV